MKKVSKSMAIGIAIGVVVLVGGALCMSALGSLGSKQDAVAKLHQQVKDRKQVEVQLADAEAKLATNAEKVKHLEESVTQAAYVPTLLSELEKFGKQNGIDVLGVRPMEDPAKQNQKAGDQKEKKPYDELNIEVKGRGTFADVQRFVDAIKTFPKIVALRTVALTPKSATNDTSGALDLTITMRAYIFPPPAAQTQSKPISAGSSAFGGPGDNRREG